jgi:hypothetical protein
MDGTPNCAAEQSHMTGINSIDSALDATPRQRDVASRNAR